MAHRKTKQHTVNVVKAQFCAPENISYLDLFEGFKKGKNKITFNYSAKPKQTLYFTGHF